MAKKKNRPIVSYILSSLMMLGFSIVFSLLSLIFALDKIPGWVQFIVSLVFTAPTVYITLVQGRNKGERLYKEYSQTSLRDLHSGNEVKLPLYKCVYHVLGFAVPLIILIVLGFILRNNILQVIPALILFPMTLLFMSVKALNLASVTWVPLVIYIPYVLILSGVFILGYLLRIAALKKQQSDIESELRTFNN